jgi:hypothetical protein
MDQNTYLGLMALSEGFGNLSNIGAGRPTQQSQVLPLMMQQKQQEAKRQQTMDALRAAGINIPGGAPAGAGQGILPPGGYAPSGSPMPSGGLGAAPTGGAPQAGLGLPPGANPGLLAAYGQINPDGLLSTLVEAQLNPKAPPAGPTSVEEYRFAQSQGFDGSYEDFLRQKASWSRAPGTSVRIVNEGSIPAGHEVERDDKGRIIRIRPMVGSSEYVDAVANASNVVAKAENAIQNIDALIADPRLKNATGWGSYIPVDIPGVNAEVRARMGQVQGEAFSQALQQLRGLGAVSNVEGEKASQAIARLNAAQSYEEYIAAVQDFRSVISGGVDRARNMMQVRTGRAPAPPLNASEKADAELMRDLGLE